MQSLRLAAIWRHKTKSSPQGDTSYSYLNSHISDLRSTLKKIDLISISLMVGFIYRYSAFGVTISVYSHTHDTAPTRALLFDLFSLINFFITPIFYMPAEPASEQSERLQQYAARSAPLKAHTAQRTAHCYTANVAPCRAPQLHHLTSHHLMSIGTNVAQ